MLEKKKCVFIGEDYGNLIEIDSSLKDLSKYLKGTVTIIGAIPQIDAVIIKCNDSPFDLMVNRNTQCLPIKDNYVLGPVLIVRMDENSEHQDLTLSEVEPMLHHQV